MKKFSGKSSLALHICIVFMCLGLIAPLKIVSGQPVLFDFDNAPIHSPLPINLTVGGITAHFSATGQGFSIQQANVMGFTPQGFAGLCIYPSSVFPADLLVSFDHTLTAFSIMYACQELGCDDAARMRVTAYMNGNYVGTNTRTATFPGTWPSDTLRCSFAQGFNSVVVHYDQRPPTCQDYGPIFMADNMIVATAVTTGTLNQKLLIQGFYNSATDLMIRDTVTVYLRNSSSPYAIVDFAKSFLNTSGSGVFTFSSIANGTPYFIQIAHRNSVETWSAIPVSFVSNNLSYDFTSSALQAYGSNMIQLNASPIRFGIYGGDVNQDWAVDLSDVVDVFNDASNFASGYLITDVTGDNFVDLSDLTLTFNNSSMFVGVITP